MQGIILHPPNSQHLSDDVISTVVQLSRRSNDTQRTTFDTSTRCAVPVKEEDRLYSYGRYGTTPINLPPTSTPSGGKIYPTPAIGEKRKTFESPVDSCSKRVKICRGPDGTVTELTIDETLANLLDLGTKIERKRRRDNQRRYRQKQADRATLLETTTQQLRNELETLKTQRDLAIAASSSNYNVWSVAVNYLRLFSRGLRRQREAIEAQLEFVRKTMTADVSTKGGFGAEAVMRSWRFSLWFDDVKVELKDMLRAVEGLLISRTTTSMTITERTLRNVFLNLSSDERYQDWVNRLLGQRIIVRGSTQFQWDHTYGGMASVMTQEDLLSPMLHLLGTLENVSRIFSTALISLDLQWREHR